MKFSNFRMKWNFFPYSSVYLSIILCIFVSCYNETPVDVVSDFSIETKNNDYEVPATIIIENKSTGANNYSWNFEGGIPESSDKKEPGGIRYLQAGEYTIRLVAWNDYHRSTKELKIQLDSASVIRFEPEILINSFVPADVQITNDSYGADEYEWTFEGGNPSDCNQKIPPIIHYDVPGEYEIRLLAKAGRKNHTISKKIILLPALQPDFEIMPFFECEDMEIPWKANLKNKTISGITYHWYTPGGTLINDTAQHTEVHYASPGKHIITLKADNKKQILETSISFSLTSNTNLQRFNDIKLGINTSSIGCFFSSKLRKVFSPSDINEKNGKSIDFVFFGLNSSFSFCSFLSPDEIDKTVFDPIPDAQTTIIDQFPEESGISFSVEDFDAMKNDFPLRSISLKPPISKKTYFNPTMGIPKIILFQTQDGRKGIIKVKQTIQEETNSYILADIKIQKEKTN